MSKTFLNVKNCFKSMRLSYVGLFLFLFVFLAMSASAQDFDYVTDANDPTIKRLERSYKISLDSLDPYQDYESLDFQNYNFLPPPECNSHRINCYEKSYITINVKKEWKIEEVVPSLTNPDLTCKQFQEYYPDLPPGITITTASPLEHRLIAQKILMYRGFLDIDYPTGIIGYLTELAAIQLGHIKGCGDFNSQKGVYQLGPCIVDELNGLKNRMCEAFYLEDNPLPPFNPEELETQVYRRWNSLLTSLRTVEKAPGLNAILNKLKWDAENLDVGGSGGDKSTYVEGSATLEKIDK